MSEGTLFSILKHLKRHLKCLIKHHSSSNTPEYFHLLLRETKANGTGWEINAFFGGFSQTTVDAGCLNGFLKNYIIVW